MGLKKCDELEQYSDMNVVDLQLYIVSKYTYKEIDKNLKYFIAMIY